MLWLEEEEDFLCIVGKTRAENEEKVFFFLAEVKMNMKQSSGGDLNAASRFQHSSKEDDSLYGRTGQCKKKKLKWGPSNRKLTMTMKKGLR